MTFPSVDELRAASLSLMVAPLVAGLTAAVDRAIEVELYHSRAASLGVSRERADTLLTEAQGLAAGSTPSTAELAAAWSLVLAEAMA